ncbi:MAG: hypothetical protein KKA73_16810 [Chloroflexi bacterium]|nr:hypothetical protein [Chloroflexota bacterium]MBU1749348.1 hypothetical protein [Chloroflexota bacterium]MBU1879528.1 hypothetical protein [Chloroflexota bacterium]
MTAIDAYLEELQGHLAVDMLTEREILREARAHLEEIVAEEVARGRDPREATHLAISRFGEARAVAREMESVHGNSVLEALLSTTVPVALALAFKWVGLPLIQGYGAWQHLSTPALLLTLSILALLTPGLFLRRWRLGFPVWLFFGALSVMQVVR